MPGLPQHIVFAEAAWRPQNGFFVIGDVRFASEVYAENTNQTRIGSHAVLMRGSENAGILIVRSWSYTPASTIFSTVTTTATFESMPIATGQTR